jgi:hypothetical protein
MDAERYQGESATNVSPGMLHNTGTTAQQFSSGDVAWGPARFAPMAMRIITLHASRMVFHFGFDYEKTLQSDFLRYLVYSL